MPRPVVQGPIPTVVNPGYRSSSSPLTTVGSPTRTVSQPSPQQATRQLIIDVSDILGSFDQLQLEGTGIVAVNLGNGRLKLTFNAGASTSPGGSDKQLQYNDAGSFGGAANTEIQDGDLAVGTNLGPVAQSGTFRASVGSSGRARNFADDKDIGLWDWEDDGGSMQELALGTYGDGAPAKTTKRLSACVTDLFFVWCNNAVAPFQVGKIGSQYATFITYKSNFTIQSSSGHTEADYGGGQGVVFWGSAFVVPTTNPTAGVIEYVESFVKKYRQPSGQVVVLDGEGVAGEKGSTSLACDGSDITLTAAEARKGIVLLEDDTCTSDFKVNFPDVTSDTTGAYYRLIDNQTAFIATVKTSSMAASDGIDIGPGLSLLIRFSSTVARKAVTGV